MARGKGHMLGFVEVLLRLRVIIYHLYYPVGFSGGSGGGGRGGGGHLYSYAFL